MDLAGHAFPFGDDARGVVRGGQLVAGGLQLGKQVGPLLALVDDLGDPQPEQEAGPEADRHPRENLQQRVDRPARRGQASYHDGGDDEHAEADALHRAFAQEPHLWEGDEQDEHRLGIERCDRAHDEAEHQPVRVRPNTVPCGRSGCGQQRVRRSQQRQEGEVRDALAAREPFGQRRRAGQPEHHPERDVPADDRPLVDGGTGGAGFRGTHSAHDAVILECCPVPRPR